MALTEQKPSAEPEGLRRFTYRDLLAMERAGILGEDEHLELLGGQLVTVTVNPPHAAAVTHLNRRLSAAFADRAQVVVQSPLRVSDDLDDLNLPQPDLMLAEGPEKIYPDHPRPHGLFLLIEVSDSTLTKDRQVKLPLYASVLVHEVWIVNLLDKQIKVYTEPRGRDYLNDHRQRRWI